jgi:uncharacterized membrane protein
VATALLVGGLLGLATSNLAAFTTVTTSLVAGGLSGAFLFGEVAPAARLALVDSQEAGGR